MHSGFLGGGALATTYEWVGSGANRVRPERAVALQQLGFLSHLYITTFRSNPPRKAKWCKDSVMELLMRQCGAHTNLIEEEYMLVPDQEELCVRDVARYFAPPKAGNWLAFNWDIGKYFYYKTIERCLSWQPEVLSYEEVVEHFVNKKTSPTGLYFGHQNKGKLLEHPGFYKHFVETALRIIDGTFEPLSVANLKIEIRLRSKVETDKKARAFIVGPIEVLLLDNMLNLDIDMQVMKRYRLAKTGMGMSLFGGDYDDMIRDALTVKDSLEKRGMKTIMSFYDAPAWDKNFPGQVALDETDVICKFYERYIKIEDLLGVEYIPPERVGQKVDTHAIRMRLAWYGFQGAVKTPNGDAWWMNGKGMPSGKARTLSANGGGHKIMNYTSAASCNYRELEDFERDCYIHHTGDDQFCVATPELHEAIGKAMALTYNIEQHVCSDITEVEYLSTQPYWTGHGWVPHVHPNKILASLLLKGPVNRVDHRINLNRLSSARLLLRYSSANSFIKDLFRAYTEQFRNAIQAAGISVGPYTFTDENIDSFYLCRHESDVRREVSFFTSALALEQYEQTPFAVALNHQRQIEDELRLSR